MATVFVSCKTEDEGLADLLVPLLEAKGHRLLHYKQLFIGAEWRKHFLDSLLNSDVMLLVLTKHTEGSQFVSAEVGVVRATEADAKALPSSPITDKRHAP